MKRLLFFFLLPPLSIFSIFGQNTVQRSVFFDTDKATLRPQAQAVLQELVDSASKMSQFTLTFQGRTDSDGSSNYNQDLSVNRTRAVHKFLIAKGISAENISIVGLSETQPITDNTSEDGKQRNRRVDITLETLPNKTMVDKIKQWWTNRRLLKKAKHITSCVYINSTDNFI